MRVDETTTNKQQCASRLQKQIITNNFTLNPNWQANKSKSSLSLNNSQPQQQKLVTAKNQLFFWSSFASSKSGPANAERLDPLGASSRFHRASVDGCVETLCGASRRDCNQPARDLMDLTPTLLAAQCGQLDALRVLVGRGGDPERVSADGSSALHLAAARNHLKCVSFLVNFGVNMWALDNDLHTAKDVAAIEQQHEVQDYLDQMMAKQSAINTKQVQKLKERAKLAAEKRVKRMRKEQMKAIKQVERDEKLLAKLASSNRRLLKSAHSISDIKLVGRNETASACSQQKRILAQISASLSSASCASNSFSSASSAASAASVARNLNQLNYQLRNQRSKLKEHQSMNDLFSLGSASKQQKTDLDESAYSSSFSSTSGYLSSSSARSLIKAVVRRGGAVGTRKLLPATFESSLSSAAQREYEANLSSSQASSQTKRSSSARPKYSDLVAIKQLELKSKQQAAAAALSSGDESKRKLTGQTSVSSATSGQSSARLKGIVGGVSRKVHLKRLLFQQQQRQQEEPAEQQQAELSNKSESKQREAANKLSSEAQQARNKSKTKEQRTSEVSSRATVTRANSEPDLSQVVWSDAKSSDLLDENCELNALDLDESNEHSQRCAKQAAKHSSSEGESSLVPPAPPPLPPTLMSCRRIDPHAQQHQCLLTKCLSQLKLQHEEAAIGQQAMSALVDQNRVTGNSAQLRQCNAAPLPTKQVQFDNSDELIRHQLSASEFPLRPSLIKQKQLNARCSSNEQTSFEPATAHARPTTVLSVDSIGSAGSLVQRNSSSPQSSSPSCTRSSDSSAVVRQSGQVVARASDANNNASGSLDDFLTKNGLLELKLILTREQIDLEALLLLNEDDLKSLNILLGPRRKLLNAIEQHRNSIGRPKKVEAATTRHRMPPLVVDTKF